MAVRDTNVPIAISCTCVNYKVQTVDVRGYVMYYRTKYQQK